MPVKSCDDAIGAVAALLRRSFSFRGVTSNVTARTGKTATGTADPRSTIPASHSPSDWLGHIAAPPCSAVKAPVLGGCGTDPRPIPLAGLDSRDALRSEFASLKGIALSSVASERVLEHWLVQSAVDRDLPALAAASGVSAVAAEERKRLQLPGLSLGPASGGAVSHCSIEAAAQRIASCAQDVSHSHENTDAGARAKTGALVQSTGDVSASTIAAMSVPARSSASSAPSAPVSSGSAAVLNGLIDRRRAVSAAMLAKPAPPEGESREERETEGVSLPCSPPASVSALQASVSQRVQLRALHARRCLACVARGDAGILVAPNAAPLQLLAAGALPERGPAAWFRKAATAATLLPLFQLLPLAAATADASKPMPMPPHLAAAGLRSQLQHAVGAALASVAEAGDGGAGSSTVRISLPLALRIINPTDLPILVAIAPQDAAFAQPRGKDGCTGDTSGFSSTCIPAQAMLAFPSTQEASTAAGIDTKAPELSLPPASSFLSSSLQGMSKDARAALAGGASSPALLAPLVVSVGGFEEMSVDEIRSEGEEKEAAAADAEELLRAAGEADAAAAAELRRLLPTASSSDAVLVRWRHVLTLRCELRLHLDAAALAAQVRSAAAAPSEPLWLNVQAAAQALVLFPAATLAHRAGMSGPSAAAAAANCAVKLPLRVSCSVPLLQR